MVWSVSMFPGAWLKYLSVACVARSMSKVPSGKNGFPRLADKLGEAQEDPADEDGRWMSTTKAVTKGLK